MVMISASSLNPVSLLHFPSSLLSEARKGKKGRKWSRVKDKILT